MEYHLDIGDYKFVTQSLVTLINYVANPMAQLGFPAGSQVRQNLWQHASEVGPLGTGHWMGNMNFQSRRIGYKWLAQ